MRFLSVNTKDGEELVKIKENVGGITNGYKLVMNKCRLKGIMELNKISIFKRDFGKGIIGVIKCIY